MNALCRSEPELFEAVLVVDRGLQPELQGVAIGFGGGDNIHDKMMVRVWQIDQQKLKYPTDNGTIISIDYLQKRG